MNRSLLVVELNKTAAVFRVELSAPAYEGYWEAFAAESDADFTRACFRARAECDFFPTIRELRKFLPSRESRRAVAETDRYLRHMRQIGAKAAASWPARIGPSDPTPVAELLGPYLQEPAKEVH